jgi:hypothetical protein
MDSIERMRNAINMKEVDRLPLDFEFLGETDIKNIWWKPAKNWKPKRYEPWYMDTDVFQELSERDKDKNTKKEDEWGTIWGFGSIVGVIGEPLEYPIKDLKDIKSYKFPDPGAEGRLDGFYGEFERSEGKYINAIMQCLLFERLHFLIGFNETLMGIIQSQKEIEYLLDKIVDHQIGLIKNLDKELKGKVHGIVGSDDWGTQTSTFISPQLWRKIFKPRYEKLSQEIHKCGYDLWLHSDGKIEEIIPDLIELGVNVFQLPQPSSVLGISQFGDKFAGKACHGLYIDIQSTAIHGTEEEIIQEARDLVNHWSDEKGSGVIAIDYNDPSSVGTKTKNSKIALKAFKEAWEKKYSIYKSGK